MRVRAAAWGDDGAVPSLPILVADAYRGEWNDALWSGSGGVRAHAGGVDMLVLAGRYAALSGLPVSVAHAVRRGGEDHWRTTLRSSWRRRLLLLLLMLLLLLLSPGRTSGQTRSRPVASHGVLLRLLLLLLPPEPRRPDVLILALPAAVASSIFPKGEAHTLGGRWRTDRTDRTLTRSLLLLLLLLLLLMLSLGWPCGQA